MFFKNKKLALGSGSTFNHLTGELLPTSSSGPQPPVQSEASLDPNHCFPQVKAVAPEYAPSQYAVTINMFEPEYCTSPKYAVRSLKQSMHRL